MLGVGELRKENRGISQVGMKKELYGIGTDFFKGVRKGLSPSRRTSFKERDVKAGTKKILGSKPKFGNFQNLGY